jgi:hypothetical protein
MEYLTFQIKLGYLLIRYVITTRADFSLIFGEVLAVHENFLMQILLNLRWFILCVKADCQLMAFAM